MKKISSYLSLWHTLFLGSILIIIYLVTVQLTEAISFSSAGVVYFNQPNAEISWEPSRGPVSHYLLRITDTHFLSMNDGRSRITTVKEIKCNKPSFDISCANNHSYQVSVKAVSFRGFSSEFSPPSILFISDQSKPEIFPDPLPSPLDLRSPDITVSGGYRELNLDSIQINGFSVAIDRVKQTFSGEVKLEPGRNTIAIVAIDLAGNSSSRELEVFYMPNDNPSFLAANESIHPFATDYNGDDIIDLLIGAPDGKIALYVNRGNNENPLFSVYTPLTSGPDGEIIDVGERAVPCMADLNGDGLNDLLVGSGEGYLYYSKNEGSSEHPLLSQIERLEDIMHQPIKVAHNCKPAVVDWDENGINDILLGSANGLVMLSINQGENNDPQLTSPTPLEMDGEFLKVEGTSHPFVIDWDDDGGKDLLIGDEGGYLHLYLNSVVSGEPDLVRGEKIKIAEHSFVLESKRYIPYFLGRRMAELIL